MERFVGLIGIAVILTLAFALSNNKKRINLKTVFSGLAIQLALALFVLKTPVGCTLFHKIGLFIQKLLNFSDQGGNFVFGVLTNSPQKMNMLFGDGASFIFVLKLIPTIIFILVLVNIFYYFGIMQKVVAVFAKAMYKLMDVSGAEALSNVASAFVGQIEAQILVKPYLKGMTMSELLASMSGSMACIAGGVMAIYINMGVPASYLLTASIMAAPGALVISKIIWPETLEPETKNEVKIEVKKTHVNVIDAIAHAASQGMKVSINVVAMLIGLIALINLIDWMLGGVGLFLANTLHMDLTFMHINLHKFSLNEIFGSFFSAFAVVMGVPLKEAPAVGALMGTKMVFNEFIAYTDLMAIRDTLSQKSVLIASFALCGFANLGSIAIQIGGISELAPNRRDDLAKLGFKALICGTLASYLSASIAGILL